MPLDCLYISFCGVKIGGARKNLVNIFQSAIQEMFFKDYNGLGWKMDEKIGDCPRNLGGWVEFIEMDEYWYLLLNTLGEVLSGYSILFRFKWLAF
jgi:hypothetical protein